MRLPNTGLYSVAKRITEETMGNTLSKGQYHNKDGVPIYIIDGQFWGSYGLSNSWSWKELKANGKFGKIEHGYGGNWPKITRKEALELAKGKK